MAIFKLELPADLIHDFEALANNTEELLGEMVKAGAETAMSNIKTNMPRSWLKSNIMECLKITKVYKTPSDGGINCKVGFYGYFYNHRDIRVPAPLVVNVTEYGASDIEYPKHPFMRKSMKKKNIEDSMHLRGEAYVKRMMKAHGFHP